MNSDSSDTKWNVGDSISTNADGWTTVTPTSGVDATGITFGTVEDVYGSSWSSRLDTSKFDGFLKGLDALGIKYEVRHSKEKGKEGLRRVLFMKDEVEKIAIEYLTSSGYRQKTDVHVMDSDKFFLEYFAREKEIKVPGEVERDDSYTVTINISNSPLVTYDWSEK